MKKLARLKPYNGRTHVLRQYTVFGIKFQEIKGWYEVDDDVAAYLVTVPQKQGDPYSAPAFDVCTPPEAEAIDRSEKKMNARRLALEANPTYRPAQRALSAGNAQQETVASRVAAAKAAKAEAEALLGPEESIYDDEEDLPPEEEDLPPPPEEEEDDDNGTMTTADLPKPSAPAKGKPKKGR